MSLKDLLPPGAFDEITSELKGAGKEVEDKAKICCPVCHKKIVYDLNNPFRPFCSERCKLIDLGAWASDERSIPGPDLADDEDNDLVAIEEGRPEYK